MLEQLVVRWICFTWKWILFAAARMKILTESAATGCYAHETSWIHSTGCNRLCLSWILNISASNRWLCWSCTRVNWCWIQCTANQRNFMLNKRICNYMWSTASSTKCLLGQLFVNLVLCIMLRNLHN